MKKIFLSHSTKDNDIIQKICEALEDGGAVCWFAPRDIGHGQEWAAEITRGLRDETELFVLLLSRSANESEHVLREINLADQYKVKILVFQVGDVMLSDALNYYLSIEQMYLCGADSAEEIKEQIIKILSQNDWRKKALHTKRKRAVLSVVTPTVDYIDRGLEGDLAEVLNCGEIAVLYGEGGMGKSCLAVQYYLANRDTYADIQFINAETPQEALASLGMPEHGEVTELKKSISSAFEEILESTKDCGEGKVLFLVDNFSYDRGIDRIYKDYEKTLADVLNQLNENPRAHVVVTTRLTETAFSPMQRIYVGDFTQDQAKEYFQKNYPHPFDHEAVEKLIRAYGTAQEEKGGTEKVYTIPPISCVSIKNTARNRGGYEFVGTSTNADLAGLVRKQMESLLEDRKNNGRLFVEILQIASFLNGTSIDKDLLFEILQGWRSLREKNGTGQDGKISRGQFDRCIETYHEKLTLLNFAQKGEFQHLAIHRRFQAEINQWMTTGREELEESIIQAFLKRIHPMSYYGTQTLADPEGIIPHALAFHEIAKEEQDRADYFRLIRALAWHYGFIRRDKEAVYRLSDYLLDSEWIPEVDRIMATIDRLMVDMNLGGDKFDEGVFEDILFDIEDLENEEEDRQEILQNLLRIHLYVLRGKWDFKHSPLEESVCRVKEGLMLCREMKEVFLEKGPISREEFVFVVEAEAQLYCRQAALERKKGGRYQESLELCDEAIKSLTDDQYLRCLNSRKMNMKNANTYLLAFAYNLQGVALMERSGNLQELYRSEELNQRALDQYLKIHYLPGIANQVINFVNIYRAQALLVIDIVNKYLNPENRTLSADEWKELYKREDILPGLEDREGNQRSVAQWVKNFHDAIFLAHEKRAEYRRVKREYHSPLSREYYAYLFTLSVAQTHYNGYSPEEKREILWQANYNETMVDGVLLRDGLEEAIKKPGLDGDRKAIYLRYQGSLYARLGGLAETEEERCEYHNLARELFQSAILLAEEIGNAKAKRLAENELRRLKQG